MQISPIHKIEAQNTDESVAKTVKTGTPQQPGQATLNAQAIDLNKVKDKGRKAKKIECMTFREATRHIYTNEGPRGFLRGLVPSLIKNSVMTGQYFSILFYME